MKDPLFPCKNCLHKNERQDKDPCYSCMNDKNSTEWEPEEEK